MKTPDYLSYDRYKKKKKNDKSKNGVLLFVTTFFATLLLFTIIAKSLSPNVDVSIGEDTGTDAKETGLGVKKFIDDRLKVIQMEDNSAGASAKGDNKINRVNNDASFDKYSQELDEKINLPTDKTDGSATTNDNDNYQTKVASNPPRPNTKDLSTPFVSPKMTKVYVGRYATIEQAKVAQGILLDSGINITPFVKDLGGSYTLQVGSYSNKAKADGLASELQRNNFPARVVQE